MVVLGTLYVLKDKLRQCKGRGIVRSVYSDWGRNAAFTSDKDRREWYVAKTHRQRPGLVNNQGAVYTPVVCNVHGYSMRPMKGLYESSLLLDDRRMTRSRFRFVPSGSCVCHLAVVHSEGQQRQVLYIEFFNKVRLSSSVDPSKSDRKLIGLNVR